ncbi:hypothetical protein D3C72_375140 [compost metagenome]
MMVDLLDHFRVVAAATDLETQAGAQADQLEQVGTDAAKITVVVKECQRRERFIDHHTDHRMLFEPRFFALGQLQFPVGEQQVTASAPALGNIVTLTGRHSF